MPPVVAVDLGATHIRAGLVSPEGRIIRKFTVRTPTEGASGRVVCDRIGALVARLLECPDGRTILYDAGSSRYGRVGASVIDPLLRHRGVRRIDALVLSHPDLDHYSGVPDLLDRFEVGCIVTGEHFRALATGESAAGLLERIDAANVPVRPVAAGDRLLGADGWEVRVLGPPARRLEIPNDRSARNDASSISLSKSPRSRPGTETSTFVRSIRTSRRATPSRWSRSITIPIPSIRPNKSSGGKSEETSTSGGRSRP